MQFRISPPATPSLDQRRDALKRVWPRDRVGFQMRTRRSRSWRRVFETGDTTHDSKTYEAIGAVNWSSVDAVDRFRLPSRTPCMIWPMTATPTSLRTLAMLRRGWTNISQTVVEIVEQNPIADNRCLGEGDHKA